MAMITKAQAKRMPDIRVEKALNSLAPLHSRQQFVADIRESGRKFANASCILANG